MYRMALDYLAFSRLIVLIKKQIEGGKITRISQISSEEFLFIIRNENENFQLLISTHPNMSYINLVRNKPENAHQSSNLLLLLRKHLENGKIVSISQQNEDRVVLFEVVSKDDYFNHTKKRMFVELIGRASNLILCDEQNKILESLKKIPLAYRNLRTIQPGIHYVLPDHPGNEKIPYDLENELSYRKIPLAKLKEEIAYSTRIYITSKEKKMDFHFIPFTFMEGNVKDFEWNEGLEWYYQDLLGQERHRQYTAEMDRLAKNEIKKNEKKLQKLEEELSTSKDSTIYKEYGDLLLTYGQESVIQNQEMIIENEFVSEKINIPYNPQMDLYQNANFYYKKYQKSKVAQIKIQEQIDLCKENIDYFKSIQFHLTQADLFVANQIKEELINQGYFRKYGNFDKSHTKNKKSSPKIYKPIGFVVDDVIIYAGQNNLQNEYLTFKMANKSHWFFHVEQGPGAHVVVMQERLNEKIIRTAAMIAAYYSFSKNSSSVAISYTQIKNIKKIPGGKPGKVIITNQKTIYIDPSEHFIENLNRY